MKGNEKGGGGLLAPSVTIQHTSIATGLTYDDLVRGFERELGRWDLAAANRLRSQTLRGVKSSGKSIAWQAREA